MTFFQGYDYGSPSIHPFVVLPFLENIHRAKCPKLNGDFVRVFSRGLEAFPAVGAKWEGAKPLLEEITFRFDRPLIITPAIAKIWTPSPNLHTLIITGYRDSDSAPWMSILSGHCFPYRQLTTLKITSEISIVDLLAILSETNNLVRCHIHKMIGELASHSAGARSKPLLLTDLQDLKLTGTGDYKNPPLTQFLGHINTPIMTSLSLETDIDWSHSSFTSFILQSSCNIHDLTLDCNVVDEEKIKSLGLLPSLTILRMRTRMHGRGGSYAPDIFPSALKRLTPSKEEFCLFPKLKTIEVEYDVLRETGGHASDSPFANMIEARFRLLPTSGSFEQLVVLETSVDGEIEYSCELIRLLILKRDGLNIVFDPRAPPLQSIICH